MHAGQETKMLRGAVWACALPVTIGIVLLLIALVVSLQSLSRDINFLDDILIIFPVIFCFIFGTPLSAWLACRSLRKVSQLKDLSLWHSSAGRGLLSATRVQITVAAIHMIIVSAYMSTTASFSDLSGPGVIAGVVIFGVIMNLMVWFMITLPLSLLCATIFWRVTKFPE